MCCKMLYAVYNLHLKPSLAHYHCNSFHGWNSMMYFPKGYLKTYVFVKKYSTLDFSLHSRQ